MVAKQEELMSISKDGCLKDCRSRPTRRLST